MVREKFAKLEQKISPLAEALILNGVLLLLVIIFCDMKYEVSDDFVMQTIIEGAYGDGYDPHLLFSNIILGYALKAFYLLFPKVGWYFVMHIVFCFVALTTISYVILEIIRDSNKVGRFIAWLGIFVFCGFFSDDLYILVQFTKTAAVLSAAGGILSIYGYLHCKNKKRILLIILGIILFTIGSMVRFASSQLSLLFVLCLLVLEVCHNKRSLYSVVHMMIIGIAILGVMYSAAKCVNKINGYAWAANNEYKDYLYWNHLRASVTDNDGADYEVLRATLMENGYTLEDTWMIQSWEFIDQDYFNEDSINKIRSIKDSISAESVYSIKSVLKSLWGREYYRYISAWVMCFLGLLSILVKRRNLFLIFAPIGILLFEFVYCILGFRIVYRVELSSFFCASAVILYILALSVKETSSNAHYLIDEKIITRLIIALFVLIMVCRIPLYIPDRSYERMSDEEYTQYVSSVMIDSWKFDIRKYRIDISHRSPFNNIIDLMENDSEHYYICDFTTTIQLLYFNYKPWKSMPIGYYNDTYSYIGGVTSYFPGSYNVWRRNDIDTRNPYKSIANENIRIVDHYFFLTKINYYKEKYDPSAEMTQLGTYDGMEVWEIR